MKKIFRHSFVIVLGVVLLTLHGCTKAIYVPVERTVTETVELRDTVIDVHISRDTIYVESSRDTVVTAETSIAEARAEYKLGVLSLRLNNKNVNLPAKIPYKIVTVEIPEIVEVEVEKPYVPKFYKTCYAIALAIIGLFGLRLLLKKWIG